LLNSIINLTTVIDEYDDLPIYYGILCRELSSRFSKKQDYANLSKRVIEFINKNSPLYI
jgi:hypothetical protein